ncbi:hypothetical protein GGR56DRAFT_697938 [Xylariaceae sp. FL0804]|nr:hypothetical protein GGR56DRAFT_697938 [Xylariaceae sp. FL0804]
MDAAAAKRVGARLLGEVEEGSLEELLHSLRATLANTPSHHRSPPNPFPELRAIVSRYQAATKSAPPPLLSVSGRYLPLLYHLVSTLVAAPHSYAVVVVDVEGRFDVTRLVVDHPSSSSSSSSSSSFAPTDPRSSSSSTSHPATLADLRHLYVYRPARGAGQAAASVAAAADYMLYGAHGSRGREWWGTVVIGGGGGGDGTGGGGGGGGGGDVNAGWRGWLRVDRAEVPGFPVGASVEEALRERDVRQEAVDAAGWVASSPWGSYAWKDG